MSKIDGEVAAHLMGAPSAFDGECIASDKIPLWECPCRECWKLEQDIKFDDELGETYAEWRAEREGERAR